jgi:hypothetical protein
MADPIYYGDPDQGPYQDMYDTTGTLQRVREEMVSNRFGQGWTTNIPTITVTGTAISGGVLETAIVAGGETLIFTLTNGTWASSIVDDLVPVSVSGFVDGSVSGGTGWDAQVSAEIGTGDLARTDDVTVTLTIPEAASYAISGDETVTFSFPQSLIAVNGVAWTGSTALVCSPANFVVTNEA